MMQPKEFNKLVDDSAKTLSVVLSQNKTSEVDLISPASRQKEIQNKIENNVERLQKKMYEGLKACILSLYQCRDIPMTSDAIVQELQKCITSINSDEDLAQLGKSTVETSWKNQCGISNNCMQTLYEGARALFENKDYDQAENAFFVICSFDPTQFAYWVGLGHSSIQNMNYELAINAYGMASAIDPEDVWPHIWAANCFEEEKDFESAQMALEQALAIQTTITPKNYELIQSLEERIKKIQTK